MSSDGTLLSTTVPKDVAAVLGLGRPGIEIVGRYRLRALLGRGGSSEVWEADDRVTGSVIALKLLRLSSGLEAARVRREILALQVLRIPGVVRLLDEGMDGGRQFLAMERVHGKPFPGEDREGRWSTVASVAIALLETVARIHAEGVVHRDLKPANVLVDAEGRPTVLDFGISAGGRLGREPMRAGMVLGTPAYLAPEQIQGRPGTEQSDLYALGVLLYEALAGRWPHEATDAGALMRARVDEPPVPLGRVCASVPAAVASVVDQLLAREPRERPQSAADVLRLLRGEPAAQIEAPALRHALERIRGDRGAGPGAVAPLKEAALQSLFAGPERLFHLRTDVARILYRRTQGIEEAIVEELQAWVRAGIARRSGERYAVDRETLDRLEAGLRVLPSSRPERGRRAGATQRRGAERRLVELLASAGEDPPRVLDACKVAREAERLGRRLAEGGRLGQAVVALEDGLFVAQRANASREEQWLRAEERLLSTWVEVALSDWTPEVLERVLYALCRTAPRTDAMAQMEQLVRAFRAFVGAGGDRALGLVEEIAPFENPALERLRQGLRVLAARRRSQEDEAATLKQVARWASHSGDTVTRARFAGWLGRLRYRQGRFGESARLHAQAAEREAWVTYRIAARINAASALMEAFQYQAAARCAEEALVQARACRQAFYEARAEWILRSTAYRSGTALAPDIELVETAQSIGLPDIEAQICMTEAAVAYRADQHACAADLAMKAHLVWGAVRSSGPAMLLRCLALAAGAAPLDAREVQRLGREAIRCEVPALGLQALGLLARAGHARQAWRRAAPELATQIARKHWGRRMDILSVNEALDALGVAR